MKEKLANAYAPYSNYKVVAKVVTKDNKEFYGVNVENASYGATICAERNAINTAICAGYKKGDFKELHVMVDSDKLAFPCHLCRQVISEFFSNEDLLFLLNKNTQKQYLIKDIIVYPFTEDNLK